MEQPPSAHSASGGQSSQPVNTVEQPSSVRSTFASQSSQPVNTAEQPSSARSTLAIRSSQPVNTVDTPSSARPTLASRSSQSIGSIEQPQAGHSTVLGRTPHSANSNEQPPSACSVAAGRPHGIKTVPMVPSSVPISLRPPPSSVPAETAVDHRKDKTFSLDFGNLNLKDTASQHSDSALQDKLDMLQEENENLLDKKSITGTPGAPSSPMMSPLHRHVRSGSTGVANMRKSQNNAAKAAAQRLAKVMAYADEDEDEDDELSYDYNSENPTGSIGLASGRAMRSRSPMSVRTSVQPPSAHSASGGRSSQPVNTVEQPSSVRSTFASRSSQPVNTAEQPSSARSTLAIRSSQPVNTVDQPSSARSTLASRSSQSISSIEQPQAGHSTVLGTTPHSANSNEQPPSARSMAAGRPHGIKTIPMVPSSLPISLRPPPSWVPAETAVDHRKDKTFSLDFGNLNLENSASQHSDSALQDKIATLGEGVSLEACLLSRKDAALQQREINFSSDSAGQQYRFAF